MFLIVFLERAARERVSTQRAMHPEERSHHRRSIGLKQFDYASPGAYCVTIVTQGRVGFFAEVADGEMCLSPRGCFADESCAWNHDSA